MPNTYERIIQLEMGKLIGNGRVFVKNWPETEVVLKPGRKVMKR